MDKQCFHCGTECSGKIEHDGNPFCCDGCKLVYQLLQENNMGDYYTWENAPGSRMNSKEDERFLFLDNEQIAESLLTYSDDKTGKIVLNIPAIHCTSCIWLLENLSQLSPHIIKSEVNFVKKQASVTWSKANMSLRELALLLADIGYAPNITANSTEKDSRKSLWGKQQIQLGVAGFCFGNVMLLSFPEYFGFDDVTEKFATLFSWINMLFSVPVLLYSSQSYLVAAWNAFRKKFISIDIPIALGILTLFIRSSWEVISDSGPGYFDSFTGLIFFLLVGKWFQSKTYESLSFERDYRSYFPLAVTVIRNNSQEIVQIQDIEVGETIKIRNNEIIPVDGIVMSERAEIDYSFVTGEHDIVSLLNGSYVFAGGKQVSGAIDIAVRKKVEQSYLTSLWESHGGSKLEKGTESLLDTVGKYFTVAVVIIAVSAGFYWYLVEKALIWNAVSAVLIIACPCALALSVPFTYGNVIRSLGRAKFYLKSADIVEKFFSINQIIFDKTGTLTLSGEGRVNYDGRQLTQEEIAVLYSLAAQSIHPYSKKIQQFFKESAAEVNIEVFKEFPGKGLEGVFKGKKWKLGSGDFVGKKRDTSNTDAQVLIACDDELVGVFEFESALRKGLGELIAKLSRKFRVSLLSGDNEKDRNKMEGIFPEGADLKFGLKPDQKLKYIEDLHKEGKKVMMIGDGLNDAPSLIKSDLGISVVEDVSVFSPASDVIVKGSELPRLGVFLEFIKKSRTVVVLSIIISFLYNFVGLGLAVTGKLEPVYAAILMPLSSISVVIFTTVYVKILSKIHSIEEWKL